MKCVQPGGPFLRREGSCHQEEPVTFPYHEADSPAGSPPLPHSTPGLLSPGLPLRVLKAFSLVWKACRGSQVGILSLSLAEERKITAHNYPVVFLLPRLLGRGPVDGPRRAEWVRSLSRCGFEMFQLKKIYVVTTDSTGPGATRYKTGWQPSLLASRLGL